MIQVLICHQIVTFANNIEKFLEKFQALASTVFKILTKRSQAQLAVQGTGNR
jgi:hypothetical protein